MGLLNVDLQEGFSNDTVSIRVDGTEVFSKKNVTTKQMIGLAESFTVQVPNGPFNLQLDVPMRNLKKVITLKMDNVLYLGISIRGTDIEVIQSGKSFGYM